MFTVSMTVCVHDNFNVNFNDRDSTFLCTLITYVNIKTFPYLSQRAAVAEISLVNYGGGALVTLSANYSSMI